MNIRDKLAELFAQTSFAAPDKKPATTVSGPTSASGTARSLTAEEIRGWYPRDGTRELVLTPEETGDHCPDGRSHRWSISKGRRSCWLCDADGGIVGEDLRPRLRPYAVVDRSCGAELNELMARAQEQAASRGHRMRPWKRRPNDRYGRYNSSCATCARWVVVGPEAAPGLPMSYGEALTEECGGDRSLPF